MHPAHPWPCLGILKLLLVVLCLNHLVLHALGGLTNRTVDDSSGDSVTGAKVVYVPDHTTTWKNQDECQTCAIVPDTKVRALQPFHVFSVSLWQDAFDNTWSGVTYNTGLGTVTATFSFSGGFHLGRVEDMQ